MSIFISQDTHQVRRAGSVIAVTVVQLVGASDTVELPNMANSENCVVQLRRPGDPDVVVTQSDIDTVAITGGVIDGRILLVSLHDDPIPEPRS